MWEFLLIIMWGKGSPLRNCLFSFLIIYFFSINGVNATQSHGGAEGLIAHQFAHIFFLVSMLYFAIKLRRTNPEGRGWKYLGIAAILFVLWNVNTFIVHTLREFISGAFFTGRQQDFSQVMVVISPLSIAYYTGKITEHFLLVSGSLLFLLGIKKIEWEALDKK